MAFSELSLSPMTEEAFKAQVRPRIMMAENHAQKHGGDSTFWSTISKSHFAENFDDWFSLTEPSGRILAIAQITGYSIYRVALVDTEDELLSLRLAIELGLRQIADNGYHGACFHCATTDLERRALDELGFVSGPENEQNFVDSNSDKHFYLGFPSNPEVIDQAISREVKIDVYENDKRHEPINQPIATLKQSGWQQADGTVRLADRVWIYRAPLGVPGSVSLRIFVDDELWSEGHPDDRSLRLAGIKYEGSEMFFFDEICPKVNH